MNVKLIKEAATSNDGWAIGIIEEFHWQTGASTGYAVIRINPKHQYLALTRHKEYESARAAANEEWTAEVNAMR